MDISALGQLKRTEGTWNAIQSAVHCVHSPLGFWLKKKVFVFQCIFCMNQYLFFLLELVSAVNIVYKNADFSSIFFFLINQLKILHFLPTRKIYSRTMDLLSRSYCINWEQRVVSCMRNDWNEALNKHRLSKLFFFEISKHNMQSMSFPETDWNAKWLKSFAVVFKLVLTVWSKICFIVLFLPIFCFKNERDTNIPNSSPIPYRHRVSEVTLVCFNV